MQPTWVVEHYFAGTPSVAFEFITVGDEPTWLVLPLKGPFQIEREQGTSAQRC